MRKPPSDQNQLLSALPPADLLRIQPSLSAHPFLVHATLHESGKQISHVYFPVSGVASIVTTMSDGATVEAATVGNEGVVGLPLFMEAGSAPLESFVQIPGDSLRMKAAAFRDEIERKGALHGLVQQYTQALFRLVAQSTACNRLHSQLQRCARWLLMAHDRVKGDTIQLTHEFLSQMLGVRRATVTVAAGELKRRGLITYRQGSIHINDRKALEQISCECYGAIRREFDRLAPNS